MCINLLFVYSTSACSQKQLIDFFRKHIYLNCSLICILIKENLGQSNFLTPKFSISQSFFSVID